jgi:hypothetical protein
MANDTFTLGGLQFDDFSTPSDPPFVGRQVMAIHKLPDGARVIDVIGPDDHDYSFSGIFWGANAAADAEALDAMRMAGRPIELRWGDRAWTVMISEATIHCRRYPMWFEYSITVVVAANNMFGPLGLVQAGIDQLLSADMATAMSLMGL